MSSPFVKITDGKLNLFNLDLPDCDIRVVCILGKARMGKSTFLNTMVTHLEGTQPFQTQNDDEHCTRGMDYYFCKEERIVLMDCQGLALEDSSHDPALLLFAYLISDVIIFNERMMLQNEALKLLEPVCTFMPYLDMKEEKPKLYFRISDGDIVKDIQKNLDKVIYTEYNDQYESIRGSLVNLFSVIGMVKTDTLDKKTKNQLQTGDYASLLVEELGFRESIHTILQSLPSGISCRQWKENVGQYIRQINQNEKISIEKLDVVGQSGKIDILEWIATLEIPIVPTVDGTHLSYTEQVIPMIKYKRNILSEFTKKFKAIPDSVKKRHYQKLSDTLLAPIKLAEIKCEEFAEEFVKTYVEKAQKEHSFPDICTNEQSITHRPDSFFHDYMFVLHELEEKCKDIYLPIHTKYTTWVKEQLSIFQAALDTVKRKEQGFVLSMKNINKDELTVFKTDLLEIIRTLDRSILEKKTEKLMMEYCEIVIPEQDKLLMGIVSPYCLNISMKDKKLKYVLTEYNCDTVSKEYDLIQEARSSFVNSIVEILEEDDIKEAILQRKNLLLERELITFDLIEKIQEVPLVTFPLFNQMITMTEDTFQKTYLILNNKTYDTLIKKGYITKEETILSIKKNDLCTVYSMTNNIHIAYLYNHRFTKELARASVEGFIFPK